jgi:hypothetical protein
MRQKSTLLLSAAEDRGKRWTVSSDACLCACIVFAAAAAAAAAMLGDRALKTIPRK